MITKKGKIMYGIQKYELQRTKGRRGPGGIIVVEPQHFCVSNLMHRLIMHQLNQIPLYSEPFIMFIQYI